MAGTRSGGGAGRHGEPKKKLPSCAVLPIRMSTCGLAPGTSAGDCGQRLGIQGGQGASAGAAELRLLEQGLVQVDDVPRG